MSSENQDKEIQERLHNRVGIFSYYFYLYLMDL